MPYTIKRGDTLGRIAAMFGVSLQELLTANPGKFPNPNLIYPGQVVALPDETAMQPPSFQNPGSPPETPESDAPVGNDGSNDFVYVVVNGIMMGAPRYSVQNKGYTIYETRDEALTELERWRAENQPAPEEPLEPEQPVDTGEPIDPPPITDDTDTSTPDDPDAPAVDSIARLNAKAYLEDLMSQYGLEGLGDWLWEQIQSGAGDSGDYSKILLDLRETQIYKDRFPAMDIRNTNRLNAITERDYIDLENEYAALMRMSGLPREFYDQRNDFTNFIANDVSPLEVQDRINEGYKRVAQTDPAIRDAFNSYYGFEGDNVLAALFLDPDRASNTLIAQARAAEVGGLGQRAGVTVGRNQAEEIAGTSPSANQIIAGMAAVGDQMPLQQETFSEQTDLTQADLLASVFNTSGALNARRALRDRRNRRMAAFSGGGGSAFFAGQGFVGLGVAGQ